MITLAHRKLHFTSFRFLVPYTTFGRKIDCLAIMNGSNCAVLASRIEFKGYIGLLRNVTNGDLSLVIKCGGEICGALRGMEIQTLAVQVWRPAMFSRV